MDYLSIIRQPIASEMEDFIALFNQSMSHPDGLLSQALDHIRQRAGKRMRPMLILLMASNFGRVNEAVQHAAVGLELLHTASLVHEVGDYILSTALLCVSRTHSEDIVRYLAELGRTLSNGEILQLSNIRNSEISEEVYYQVIKQKTAALFEACAGIGTLSVGAPEESIEAAKKFGQNLGIIFQIRDDIFDYFPSSDIGKPTGNDMAEGKLTLPVLYALRHTQDEAMMELARKVKRNEITADEIAQLVDFTKRNGGIEYAEGRMWDFHREASDFLRQYVRDEQINLALSTYLDYVIKREK